MLHLQMEGGESIATDINNYSAVNEGKIKPAIGQIS